MSVNDELKGQLIKTGTTTIGIVCKDGIVLAADKQATADYFVAHSRVDKIVPITKNIAVTTAGLVSDIQLICKLTRAELKLKTIRTKQEPTVKEAANLFSTVLYHNIRKFSPIMGIAAFIVGGVDDNGHWLYDTAPDGAALEYKDFVSTGSGSILAYGVLESEYNQDITLKEGVKLALKAINSSLKRDVATGGGVDVITITKEGIKKVFAEEVKSGLTLK